MKKVLVMMSSYNGKKYIRAQMKSILEQKGAEVHLLVRDDGSTDGTADILRNYCQRNQRTEWYCGRNQGPEESFMDLIHRAGESEYYAFSDQDDYWMPHKLYRALTFLKNADPDIPAMYHCNYFMSDENLKTISRSRKMTYVSSTLKKAFVSSNATGCTMVFNNRLLECLKKKKPAFPIMHDGWAHKVCIALGGSVFYDPRPCIVYRQHDGNVIGGRESLMSRMAQHMHTLLENPGYRSRVIRELYRLYGDDMTNENKKICREIIHYAKGINRLKLISDREYSTGNLRVDLTFLGAVLLGVC